MTGIPKIGVYAPAAKGWREHRRYLARTGGGRADGSQVFEEEGSLAQTALEEVQPCGLLQR
jgi:hypothetical protein